MPSAVQGHTNPFWSCRSKLRTLLDIAAARRAFFLAGPGASGAEHRRDVTKCDIGDKLANERAVGADAGQPGRFTVQEPAKSASPARRNSAFER